MHVSTTVSKLLLYIKNFYHNCQKKRHHRHLEEILALYNGINTPNSTWTFSCLGIPNFFVNFVCCLFEWGIWFVFRATTVWWCSAVHSISPCAVACCYCWTTLSLTVHQNLSLCMGCHLVQWSRSHLPETYWQVSSKEIPWNK